MRKIGFMPGGALRAAALITGSALLLSGCATGDAPGAGGDGGEGIAFGATKEDYIAAFEDVAPITLSAQTAAPKGATNGAYMERYFDAVTEWSGGKISFDVAYSNAIVPQVEVDNALQDGRLDIGLPGAAFERQEYPVAAELVATTFMANASPLVGPLHQLALTADAALSTSEWLDEYENAEIKPLLPVTGAGAAGILCKEPRTSLADMNGARVTTTDAYVGRALSATGADPTSIVYTELYEAVQRGVVDCIGNSLSIGVLLGVLGDTKYVTVDPTATFTGAGSSFAVSQRAWDGLPLIAQQLMWDRIDVAMEGLIAFNIWPNIVDGVNQVVDAGGVVQPFEDDAAEAIRAANAESLEGIRSAHPELVSNVEASTEKWLDRITSLGYDASLDYVEFAEKYADLEFDDLAPFIDELFEEVYLPHRPA